ncbi:hypothetical protein [Labedaea rhizosphaerae]|uniref:Uncharacterized protein n=1 Tax=Labedaea rhizosphaerae TaxID=598644 RepID=A0A4R6RXK3_LABRH|nr:hypothetical protein [Labedaea rhizosphaerae]TDP91809.1 hypothetical protein EV186_10818 [Labedaea rhizosphaerae]
MTEQVTGPRSGPLPELLRILWSARIDTTANRWHLTRRVIPELKTLADAVADARLGEAAKHAEAAIAHLDIMVEELRTAIDFIQAQNPDHRTG